MVSVSQRIMPPMKIAKVVANGRYIPTATSIGLRTCNMIIATPRNMPMTTSGQAMSPPTMPCASDRHQAGLRRGQAGDRRSRAAGADVALVQHQQREVHHEAATSTAISSTIWIVRGVPPRM